MSPSGDVNLPGRMMFTGEWEKTKDERTITRWIMLNRLIIFTRKNSTVCSAGLGSHRQQCAVLDYLLGSSKEFVNQKDIEKALSLKNPTVTGILKRLDEKGFILAVPSNQDKRCKNIYPTEKAYDIQKKMMNTTGRRSTGGLRSE